MVFVCAIDAGRICEVLRQLAHERCQDKYSQWNSLRRVDKNQGPKRIDKMKIDHDSQNADRPKPYRNHNTDSEIKTGQCIEPEFVLSESESCHRAAKEYQNQRATSDQK